MSLIGKFIRESGNASLRLSDIKIVAIGGGTGQSVMLRGLKKYTSNITAIVTVADDGGGSGVLRDDLGMPPPGDIRNCILALAEIEDTLTSLLNYRFAEGMLKGQSFGNLFLAAMAGVSNGFEDAVKQMSDVLKIKGRVLPVSIDDIHLAATLQNGNTVIGESKIPEAVHNQQSKISRLNLIPSDVSALPEAIQAIMSADLIVISSGSLYTSIMPNLLVKGISEAICSSNAVTVYVCNVMTQPNETDGYSAFDHCASIIDHTCPGVIDYCIINNHPAPAQLLERYLADGADIVKVDYERFKEAGLPLIEADLMATDDNLARHNPEKLARVLIDIAQKIIQHKTA